MLCLEWQYTKRRNLPDCSVCERSCATVLRDTELTVVIQFPVLHSGCERDAALVLFTECQLRRPLVQADAEALQLVLNQLLVRDGFQTVQHYQDEVARPRCTDDL